MLNYLCFISDHSAIDITGVKSVVSVMSVNRCMSQSASIVHVLGIIVIGVVCLMIVGGVVNDPSIMSVTCAYSVLSLMSDRCVIGDMHVIRIKCVLTYVK